MVDTGRATKPQHWAGEVITLGEGILLWGPICFYSQSNGRKKDSEYITRQNPCPPNI